MTIQSRSADEVRSTRMRIPRLPGTWLVFAATVASMLVVWLVLALIYSGIGGGTNLVQSRAIISAVTSTNATSGELEVQAVLATPEYFSVTSRSDEMSISRPKKTSSPSPQVQARSTCTSRAPRN